MHYYQHHIGDFIKDTANLDDHQLATYMRMLWLYYTDEKPLTGALEDIAFAMRSDEKTIRLLLRHYFTEESDGWVHARCEREITEFHSKAEKARNSANARWKNKKEKRSNSERNANASNKDANATKNDANQEPRTKNQINTITPVGVSDEVFKDFLKLRNGLKAPVTETALKGLEREAKKAGVSLQSVMEICCQNGWRGFKADWLNGKSINGQSGSTVTNDPYARLAEQERARLAGLS